ESCTGMSLRPCSCALWAASHGGKRGKRGKHGKRAPCRWCSSQKTVHRCRVPQLNVERRVQAPPSPPGAPPADADARLSEMAAIAEQTLLLAGSRPDRCRLRSPARAELWAPSPCIGRVTVRIRIACAMVYRPDL